MDFPMQPRYDPERAIYRDCRFCQGKGCIACPGEADRDYKKAFPGGPKPILTLQMRDLGVLKKLRPVLGPEAMMAAKREGQRQAEELAKNLQPGQVADKYKVRDLGTAIAGEIMERNILKLVKRLKKKKPVKARKGKKAPARKQAATAKKQAASAQKRKK